MCTVSRVLCCSILAVDYCARHYGVKRGMSGKEAIDKCPQLHLFRVPEKRGKADLTRYRDVGAKVIQVLSQYSSCVERASVDEAFLDVSEEVAAMGTVPATVALQNTWVAGFAPEAEEDSGKEEEERKESMIGSDEGLVGEECGVGRGNEESHIVGDSEVSQGKKHGNVERWLSEEGQSRELALAIGAALANEMRRAVLRETGCTCSAGIAHNKVGTMWLHACCLCTTCLRSRCWPSLPLA